MRDTTDPTTGSTVAATTSATALDARTSITAVDANSSATMSAPADRNQLAESHLYLVQHVLNRVAARYPRHVDRAELWSAGAHGLVEASRRYDPATGVPFAHYAAIRIRGAIIDAARSRDWATRSLRRGLRTMDGSLKPSRSATVARPPP